MTVGSSVKQCIAQLKGIESTLSIYALQSMTEEQKQVFHETMMTTNDIIDELLKRMKELEREEPQYKGY